MKTTAYIRSFVALVIILLIGATAYGQPAQRSNESRRATPERYRTSSAPGRDAAVNRSEGQRPNSQRDRHQRPESKKEQPAVRHSKPDNRPQAHKPQRTQARPQAPRPPSKVAVVPAPANHHRRPVYHRHLPAQKVNRFHHRGHDYYHANHRFYRYHPGRGYVVVEAPYTRVRYLPARYQIRVYNGHRYPYYNGYFFLPVEYGYVMVPAPARPRAAFNIVLNF